MKQNRINVLIVNYNTQKLTEHCIKSINKHTPNARIYVFDNSDDKKFINNFSNVIVLDNTEGQIINFNEWLKKFPEHEKSPIGISNNYASSKHCVSVQKAIDIIDDNIILLDSDVLIKRDISELFDESCIYVGGYEHNKYHDKRLMPFICFINVNMCKKYNIKYFDEKRIVGLTENGEKYDTGCSFYVDSEKYNHREINIFKYIAHFAQGSWKRKNANIDVWLDLNKHLWHKSENNDTNIFICSHKNFEPVVNNSIYKIIDSRNISSKLFLKDNFYSELYQFKYVSDNLELPKYVGFCHYRRYFDFFDDVPDIEEIFSKYDAIVAKPMLLKTNVLAQYSTCHNVDDLDIVGNIIENKYPQYRNTWNSFINGKVLIPYNMFIMKREDFKEYIDFIFSILDEYVKIVGTDIYKRIEENKDKYIKSFYPNNTAEYQYRIGGYLAERLTNLFLLTHFKRLKTYNVIVTEEKYKKK